MVERSEVRARPKKPDSKRETYAAWSETKLMRALCRLLAALITSNVFGLCVCPGTVITHSRLIVDYKVFWPRTCYMY